MLGCWVRRGRCKANRFQEDSVFPTHDEEAVMNGAPERVAAAKRKPGADAPLHIVP